MGEILVTGGAGFIGTHTCVSLLQAGYKVIILDNLCNAQPKSILHVRNLTGISIPFYRVDLRDVQELRHIFQMHQIDAVLHFAGLKAVGESMQHPLRYYQNNIGGTMQLLQVMQEYSCHILVFSSSATVYGTQHTAPYKETLSLSASNPYGETKIITEQLLQSMCRADDNWHITALRYFNPIGAHESGLLGEQPYGIPSNIVPYLGLVANGILPYVRVYGDDYDTPDGTGIRDYVHVMDLAEGHVSALQYTMQQSGFSVFNLGTGTGCSVLELLHAYEMASGTIIPYQIEARRLGDVAVSYADVTKAKEILKWTAKRSLMQMCQDSWRFVSKKQYKHRKDYNYDGKCKL